MKWFMLGMVEIGVFLAFVGLTDHPFLRMALGACSTLTGFCVGGLVAAHVMGWRRQ